MVIQQPPNIFMMLVGRIGLLKDIMLIVKVLTGYFDLSLVDYNLFRI